MAKARVSPKKNNSAKLNLGISKIEIVKSSNLHRTLSKIRDRISPLLFEELVKWIFSSKRLCEKVFSSPFPRNFLELEVKRPLTSTHIEREYIWAGSYLILFSEKINRYLELSYDYQEKILSGSTELCKEILDIIEKEFGQSLWLIKQKIAFLQRHDGLEAQKRYSNKIKEESIENGVVSFVSHYVSYRNEPAVTPSRFVKQLEKNISSLNLDENFDAYLSYQIAPVYKVIFSTDKIQYILRQENFKSVIDYYECFIAATSMLLTDEDEEYVYIVKSIIKKLGQKITDPRINSFLINIGEELLVAENKDINIKQTFDLFLKGHYEESLFNCLKLLENYPHNFDYIEIAARSCVILKKEKIDIPGNKYLSKIFSYMCSILLRDSNSERAFTELYKVCLNFFPAPWSSSLLVFLLKENSPDPFESRNIINYYFALSIPQIHPLRITSLSYSKSKESYLKYIYKIYGDSPSFKYAENLVGKNINITEKNYFSYETSLLIKALSFLNSGRYDESIDISKNNIENSNSYFYFVYVRIITDSLINLLKINEAIDYITKLYVCNMNLINILPVKDIVEKIDKNIRVDLKGDISIPIIYNIYNKHIDNDKEHIRNYAYEDFLFNYNINKPSEIEGIIDKFDNDKIIYFLKYICIESIMDISIVFSGTNDLLQERLNVCKLLLKIDERNIDAYQSEIKFILRHITISQRMREIEQSKIYVDVESIKDFATKNFKENFSRYISFLNDGISVKDLEIRHSAREKTIQGDVDGLLSLSLPDNEINDIIETLIVDLRDQFVSSTQYGLDGYLSTRIRHGTLSGHLRRPLESANLITQKDSSKGVYKKNNFWIEKFCLHDPNQIDLLSKSFIDFSCKYDELIHKIISEWIQVKKYPSDKGLFDFTLIKFNVAYLASFITEETTFDEFLDKIFDVFFEYLRVNLKNIRYQLKYVAKNEANKLLTELRTNVENINSGSDSYELINAINRVRTELQVTFDRITEWFRLSKSTENDPFSVEEAIDISLESLKASGYNLNINTTISDEMRLNYIQGSLPSFVDILFIIFENVAKHSKILTIPYANLNVSFKDSNICLTVDNEIKGNCVSESAKNKIDNIKKSLTEKDYWKSVAKEGGTGFFKIQKILSQDFNLMASDLQPVLNFGFREENTFYVEVCIPFHLQNV